MTLEEAKRLLAEHNISFELTKYGDEKEYWYHTTLFPYTKNAKCCKVITIVIKSNNGNKDIELQFNETHAGFVFEDLRFGDYSFEFFDVLEDVLAVELISIIKEIQEGNLAVIVANNIQKNSWIWDACFDLNDIDGEVSGKKAFDEAILLIQESEKPFKGVLGKFLDKLLRTKVQYEIYDWNTYQCIVKG